MSAWMVSKGHVDCLVQAAVVEGLVPMADADKVGRMLWDENWASIAYRYEGSEPEEMLPDNFADVYRFEGAEAPLDDWTVYKQVRCYGYQTCEHAGWETSESKRLTDALGNKILVRLGVDDDAAYDDPRWGKAPWGIESISEAVAA